MVFYKKFLVLTIIFLCCVCSLLFLKHTNIFLRKKTVSIIFDFDSTIVKNETLNDILSISLNGNDKKIKQIEQITKDAMNGLITPQQSMNKRLQFATINKKTVEQITQKTTQSITEGMENLIKELQRKNVNIYIVSGGFKEVILPTANILGIKNDNVFANDFLYERDVVAGVKDNILLEKQGKVKLIKKLKNEGKIKGKTIMIGDGFTDLEVGLNKATDDFIAFTGITERENVIQEAQKNNFYIAKNADELLKILNDKIEK